MQITIALLWNKLQINMLSYTLKISEIKKQNIMDTGNVLFNNH